MQRDPASGIPAALPEEVVLARSAEARRGGAIRYRISIVGRSDEIDI
jgi:hypothetical protein